MLKSHMEAVEKQLLATSQIPANSGHSLHKGTPREAFIKEYLERHLPSNVAIGTGEIIDASSKPGQPRNQYDIVIYRRSYPKLDFGGGISGFLVESVIATIEVKSTLTQSEFGKAAKAARKCKVLIPSSTHIFSVGNVLPAVLNFIVAYDGPASMTTVHGWIATEYEKHGIPKVQFPPNEDQRLATPAAALDAVFVLGKGFLYFDNAMIGFSNEQQRRENPGAAWISCDTPSGSLLLLFLRIQGATETSELRLLNAVPYLSTYVLHGIQNLT